MHVWVEAARPKTLPAAVAPVLVGTAAAATFVAWRFAAALVVALGLQVGVNYANDYFDAAKGVDTAERVGPRRAVAAGLVTPRRMRTAMLAAFAVAAAAGVALAAAVGWELLWVGALAMLAALGYSGGPRPYASAGLGEVFVFVFFGLVATVGSQYVQDGHMELVAVAAAVPMGMLASALLIANNLRDVDTDRAAGKRTLAVRMGRDRTEVAYSLLLGTSLVFPALIAEMTDSRWPLLALVALPLAIRPNRTVHASREPADLVRALAGTARFQLAYGILLAAGLWLA